MPVVAAADFMSIMIRESVVDAGLLVKAAGGWEVIVLEKAEMPLREGRERRGGRGGRGEGVSAGYIYLGIIITVIKS